MLIECQENEIKRLETQVQELENQLALAGKNNRKGKRKAPKTEKMGRLIMFPVKKEVQPRK